MANWIIPCNPKLYDVYGAFRSLKTIDWRQSVSMIAQGDTVYIYTGRPVQAITHKCCVIDVNIPYDNTNSLDEAFNLVCDKNTQSLLPVEKYMRLELIKEYEQNSLSYNMLVKYGLVGSIQGQQRVRPVIQAAIDSVDQ